MSDYVVKIFAGEVVTDDFLITAAGEIEALAQATEKFAELHPDLIPDERARRRYKEVSDE